MLMECKETNQIATLPILLGVSPDEAGGGLVVEVVDKEGGSHSSLSVKERHKEVLDQGQRAWPPIMVEIFDDWGFNVCCRY
jgi:hypothetical protein